MPEVEVRVTQLTVSLFPDDPQLGMAYDVRVEERSKDSWAVTRMSHCLNTEGEWEYEPLPSSRDEAWKATHRFDLETALRMAAEAVPAVVVNGKRAVDYL